MDWTVFVCIVFANVLCLDGSQLRGFKLNKIIELLRRSLERNEDTMSRMPQYPADLPAAEPILPGHSLIRPAKGMLKSAMKYPLTEVGGAAVYGNLNNLGITYDKTPQRIRYSNFRKLHAKTPLQTLIENLKKVDRGSWVVIEVDPSKLGISLGKHRKRFSNTEDTEVDNRGSEIFDNSDELFEDSDEPISFRRKKLKSKFRIRGNNYDRAKFIRDKYKKHGQDSTPVSSLESQDNGDGDVSSSSSVSDEKNPGNPFTIHKKKYKQNWIWNHDMDGDHMNINPYAPPLNSAGPSGPDLFFGRKWWYFNQDDYRPLTK